MLRRFEGQTHANDYLRYRPTWLAEVYDTIVSYVREGGGVLHQAVDIGCGTGISTRLLAARFEKVIGVDVSETMLSNAPKDLTNVTYRVSPGEELGFIQNEEVDAVTCAASIHWLDLKRFYEECDRVLKPGGVVSSFTYGGRHHLDDPEADKRVMEFFGMTLSKYFDKEAASMTELYAVIEQPYNEFTRILDLPMEKTWPLSDYLGYLSTVSATRRLIDSGSMEFEELANDLLEIFGNQMPDKDQERVTLEGVTVTTKWLIKLNLSRKPK